MAYIKKLKNNELIGGTDNTDVYPITSTKAVFDENNVSQDYLNKHITGDRIESNTIPGDKLADKALTEEKVSDALMDKINSAAHGVTEEFETEVREALDELMQSTQKAVNTVSINNDTPLQPDVNKNINITVPEDLKDLNEDSEHKVVTDTEKSTWNGKQDALTFDSVPTANSNNPVKSGGVYQAIQSIDVSGQISGKADKSEMSVVAGTGANADKTTITLKSGTSATVLTQHQDVSEFLREGEVFGTGDDSAASFNSYADTVWNKQQTLSESQKQQVRENIGIADLETIRNGAAAGATAIQSVTVGTTTTGAAGSSASVVNSGTATAPVLDFTIPQGAQGVKGDTVIMGNEDTYTLYNTTGDAVDGAMTQQAVTRELAELGGEVGTIEITNVSGFSTGNYIKNNQGVGQSCPMTEATAATQDCIKIDAKAGEKYRIVGVGASSGRLWATVNKSTSKIIAAAEVNSTTPATPFDVTLTMEQDCWLVCNVYNATVSPAYKNTAETPYSITKYSPKSISRIDKIYNELGYENRQLDLIRKDDWYYSSDNPAIREYTDYYLKYAYVKSGVKLHITATNSASKTLRYGFLQTVPAIGSSVQNIVAIVGTVADRYVEMPYDGYIVFEAYTGYFEDLVVEGYYSKMVDSLTETLYGEKQEITKTLSWSDGYVNSFLYPKEIRSSTLSKFTQPFMLYAGETVEVETDTTKTGVICTTYANSLAVGDMVASMIAYTGETSKYHKFTYTATEDTKIMLSNKNSYVSRVKFYIYNKKPIDVEVEELEDRVTALEGGGVGLYKEKDNLIYTAAEHSAFNCLFFSDIHADSDRMEVIKSIANKWSAKLNCVINGGDTVENNAASGALDWYNDIASAITVDVLTCVGNHDFKNSSGYGYISLSDTYNLIIQPMIDRGVTGLNIDTGKLRYYKDYGSIRVVVIDAIKGSGSTIPFSSEYDSKYFMNGGKAWLDGVLADAITNSKSVIIVNHSPFPSAKAKYKWNSLSEFVAAKPNSFLSYHPTVTPGYNLDLMPLELGAMESVKTFEDNGGEFICWLTGHVHIDHFLDVIDHTTYGYQPLVNIATASSTATGAEHDMSRDKVKDCVDYFSVNTTLKTFSIIRLGVNMDGLLRKKNVLSYDYVGHQIIDNY